MSGWMSAHWHCQQLTEESTHVNQHTHSPFSLTLTQARQTIHPSPSHSACLSFLFHTIRVYVRTDTRICDEKQSHWSPRLKATNRQTDKQTDRHLVEHLKELSTRLVYSADNSSSAKRERLKQWHTLKTRRAVQTTTTTTTLRRYDQTRSTTCLSVQSTSQTNS